uniref:Endoribonuclease VapD n=1 Tax=Chlorobium chlorochromatii (strain CaD3) TaxID=340177 RepID=Q3AQA0_CHLCH
MFAIAFDLVVADTSQNHPKGVAQAYSDIGSTLAAFGFTRVQGSLYTTNSEDLANLFSAISALKALPWFSASVRDIRAFRVDQWSDFTNFIKL